MTDRMTRNERWEYAQFVLANTIVVEKGKMACLDTSSGEATNGAVSTTLRPIGYWDESITGDGTAEVRVRLFDHLRLHWWDNDTGTAVDAADIGSLCFILDETTVSADSTSRSVAGRVYAINATNGVLVDMVQDDTDSVASFSSGDYVPVLTDTTNVAASVLLDARFIRINNTVVVYFALTIDATAAAATVLEISLPVASVLAAANDLIGHAVSAETVGEPSTILAETTNNTAQMAFTAVGTGVVTWRGSFSYLVL